MKATGIIRRIDSLGRIVIPKEIRKNLRIKNGDNIEIFVNEEENIILRKYSHISKLENLSQIIVEAIGAVTKKDVFISNTTEYIAINGSYKRKYLEKPLSNEILGFLSNRKEIIESAPILIDITEDKSEELSYAFAPIISQGDIYGMILIASKEPITEEEFITIKVASNFLAKYLED